MKLREVMSSPAVTIDVNTPVSAAARAMKSDDIGDVIVVSGGEFRGLLTDRDLAVRVVALGRNPDMTAAGEVYSRDVHGLGPDDDVDLAVELMREHAVRRVPIVDGTSPVGMVTLGDLVERDGHPAPGDVSRSDRNA